MKSLLLQYLKERYQRVSAKDLIQHEVVQFHNELSPAALPEEISLLAQKYEDLRQRELEKTLSKLTALSVEEKQHIEKLSRSLVDKMLQEPIRALKRDTAGGDLSLRDVVKRLFRLDDEG